MIASLETPVTEREQQLKTELHANLLESTRMTNIVGPSFLAAIIYDDDTRNKYKTDRRADENSNNGACACFSRLFVVVVVNISL